MPRTRDVALVVAVVVTYTSEHGKAPPRYELLVSLSAGLIGIRIAAVYIVATPRKLPSRIYLGSGD